MSTLEAVLSILVVIGALALVFAGGVWLRHKALTPKGLDRLAQDPIHQDPDGSWWFWNETWAFRDGPFPSRFFAELACSFYAKVVLDGGHKEGTLFWYHTKEGWRRARLECVYSYTHNEGRRTYRLLVYGLPDMYGEEEDDYVDFEFDEDSYLRLIPIPAQSHRGRKDK